MYEYIIVTFSLTVFVVFPYCATVCVCVCVSVDKQQTEMETAFVSGFICLIPSTSQSHNVCVCACVCVCFIQAFSN